MDNPETLAAAQRVIERLRADLHQTQRLLEYYRDFAPETPSVSVAPPGFFAHQISDGEWAAGRLINGQLHILDRGLPDEEAAVAAAWSRGREEGLIVK